MKPFYFLILTVLLALALSGCVRSIAPGNDAQATGSAETALPSGDTSSSVTLVTPGLETVMPPVGSPADGTTEAPLAENILCAYPPEWVPYIVQEGDTLESLALLSGIEGGEIVTNNCLYATGAPPTGTTIYLPATEAVLQSQAAVTTWPTLTGCAPARCWCCPRTRRPSRSRRIEGLIGAIPSRSLTREV
jgi:hypothetical protein